MNEILAKMERRVIANMPARVSVDFGECDLDEKNQSLRLKIEPPPTKSNPFGQHVYFIFDQRPEIHQRERDSGKGSSLKEIVGSLPAIVTIVHMSDKEGAEFNYIKLDPLEDDPHPSAYLSQFCAAPKHKISIVENTAYWLDVNQEGEFEYLLALTDEEHPVIFETEGHLVVLGSTVKITTEEGAFFLNFEP